MSLLKTGTAQLVVSLSTALVVTQIPVQYTGVSPGKIVPLQPAFPAFSTFEFMLPFPPSKPTVLGD